MPDLNVGESRIAHKNIYLVNVFFFIKNMFTRNVHVESSKIKKLVLLHSISISEIRNLFFSNSYNQLKKIPKFHMGMIHSINHQ